ncbi:MAG: hypothetical protein ABSC36_02200, partial [Gaiellaceae bacterium]
MLPTFLTGYLFASMTKLTPGIVFPTAKVQTGTILEMFPAHASPAANPGVPLGSNATRVPPPGLTYSAA